MESFILNNEKCIIHDYDRKAPFSSFLPGLAGVMGIPIWSFYTNRGQAICSFGIHNKANAMMEFFPANTGYENTQIRGFRTFLRINGSFCEPFFQEEPGVVRTMEIEQNVVSIREDRGDIRMQVSYFVLPNENLGALVRKVTVENLSGSDLELEVLDGMPQIIPYGIPNAQYKEMSNLFRSWADIINTENNIPIYKTRSTSEDTAEVKDTVAGGYFYLAEKDGALLPILWDKEPIFGWEQSMMVPTVFRSGGLDAVTAKPQCFYNKIPCAFAPIRQHLKAGEKLCFTAYAGYTASEPLILAAAKRFCAQGYSEDKLHQARELSRALTADVRTHTSDKLLDAYVEQCYMDNFLRGGYPVEFGQGGDKKVVHLFSRKHGDPERDYNFFSIAGEYFSQGNGNYRDVCQNRRLDCFLHPEIEDFNVRNFFSLIQMDGYNPLEIRPCTFTISADAAQAILRRYMAGDYAPLTAAVSAPFTPGKITNTIAQYGLTLLGDEEKLVEEILEASQQHLQAVFAEGYWSDHWDYNLDLVEDYLSVYPDKKEALLYGSRSYKYYNSPAVVRPRRETYVLSKGAVRQYGAIRESEKKLALPGFDPKGTNWLKDAAGREVTTTLFEKMLTLAVNKFALLDCQGLGIEMEGGKPGWNDAMNGLPGLLGSGMAETLELRRLVNFLLDAVREQRKSVPLFTEFKAFMERIFQELRRGGTDFEYWDRVCTLREGFREEIEGGISGSTEETAMEEIAQVLGAFSARLERAVSRALEIGGGIMPTFFTYEATEFEPLDSLTPYGLPGVRVKRLERRDLPYFLEGPARYLSSCGEGDRAQAKTMAAALKETDVYDRKLKMYKTSASIEGQSMEVGRVRAFTPGWLERESIFLHMEYKYFYGLFRAGLYDEFFEAIEPALIPHLDPGVYGRSTLENSSFLASSVNPDPSVHGRGFVGRLSGSTVEMLSMWKGMLLGRGGFAMEGEELVFTFDPVLKGSLFDENGEISFPLFGKTRIVYRNPHRADTYHASVEKIVADGVEILGGKLSGEPARALRDGKLREVIVVLQGR